jgi:GTP-dependent phosphoenolpyruvate carboxykinase
MNIDQAVLSKENLEKLEYLNNSKVLKIVEEYTNLLKPSKVTVITDSQEDIN